MSTPKPSAPPPTAVTLNGETHRIRLPRSFTEREDIAAAMREADTDAKTRRACAAILAMCVPTIAEQVRPHTLARYNDDMAVLGKHVHDALHGLGFKTAEISSAAIDCYKAALADLFPRDVEVKAKEDFSEAEAVPT